MGTELGRAGELRAVEYLDKKGYVVLCRNYRCRGGEIDIVALDGNTLCFIEVKTRSSTRHGLPCEAVGQRKLAHIKRAAAVYMSRHGQGHDDARIDVVEILLRRGKYYIRHIKNIVCD